MKKLNIYCKDKNCLPERQHPTDAGLDLKAAVWANVTPRVTTKIPTGVHVEIPEGYVGLIFPRSGLASRGITLANSVGVIDSDYRGELICAMTNTKPHNFKCEVQQYDRIAQLVIVPIALPELNICETLEELSNTERGDGGFGHTGE